MVSKITAGDTLDGNYGVIGLCFSRTEEGKSNFIVDWFGWFAPVWGSMMMSRVPRGKRGTDNKHIRLILKF